MGEPVCHDEQVTSVECDTVVEQQCSKFPQEKCRVDVAVKDCNTVYEKKCSSVPKKVAARTTTAPRPVRTSTPLSAPVNPILSASPGCSRSATPFMSTNAGTSLERSARTCLWPSRSVTTSQRKCVLGYPSRSVITLVQVPQCARTWPSLSVILSRRTTVTMCGRSIVKLYM